MLVKPISEAYPSMMNQERKKRNENLPEKEVKKPSEKLPDKSEKIINEARNIAARHVLEASRKERELLAELRKRMQKL